MSKRRNGTRKRNNKENLNKIESVGGLDGDLKHVVRVISIIIIIFCAFYGLTLLLTKNGDSSKKNTNSTSTNDSISYTDILLGRSFSMPEEEYLVLYYDKSDNDLISTFATVVSDYRNEKDNYILYTVDMSNSFNKSYVSSESNKNPEDASEMAINGPTLIHFSNGSIVKYIEGKDSILEFMN